MTIFESTARRREIGDNLRLIRQELNQTATQLAQRARWTQTMLSRSETGKREMTREEIVLYLGLCGVTDERMGQLLDLADEPDEFRLKTHALRVPDQQRTLTYHESTASKIVGFEPIYIPGVLQTEDYARALFVETGIEDADAIENCVQIRVGRRAVLTAPDPAQCAFFVHENALRSMVGSPKVMQEQMLNLIFWSGETRCAVRVVPASAGSRGTAASPFQIFSFVEGRPVLCVQHETTSEFIENEEMLAAYRSVVKRVASVALSHAESRSYITSIASEYERQGEAQHAPGAGLEEEQP